MPAGLGGGAAMGIAIETTNGTYVDPTVWVPILSKTFKYTEARYFSPQLRQQVMVSDVKQGYYHIEGEVVMEVDSHFLPYFLYASRHTITKTGPVSGVYTYKAVPNKTASVQGAVAGGAKTLSIAFLENDIIFGYAGCVVGRYLFEVTDGVLRLTATMFGLTNESPAGPYTPTWSAPDLLGADAHAVFIDAAGTAPFGGAGPYDDINHATFQLEINHNPSAENRLKKQRSAQYIAFHETEITLTAELDFVDKTEYNNFVATTQQAIKLESTQGANAFATATDGTKLQLNRFAYETYDVDLAGIGDLIMAGSTGRGLAIAGGDAYELWCKSATNIT
jgi:Phage tail tube protein